MPMDVADHEVLGEAGDAGFVNGHGRLLYALLGPLTLVSRGFAGQ
jgi:hypothetical protein